MRLETESMPAIIPPMFDQTFEGTVIEVADNTQELLGKGISAARSGNRVEARSFLDKVVEADPGNESAWLWLASISEYPEELVAFLNRVLEINPENERAIEWKAAATSLLAKNFIESGVSAIEAGQRALAIDCFNHAIENDPKNAWAYSHLASLSESVEEKVGYLHKAISLDPDNDEIASAYEAARRLTVEGRLADARLAAVEERNEDLFGLIESVLSECPGSREAWMLKAHFASNYSEKLASFRRLIEIDPWDPAARANIDALTLLSPDAVPVSEVASGPAPVADWNDSFAAAEALRFESDEPIDRIPTQDLELPAELEAEVKEAFEAEETEDDGLIVETSGDDVLSEHVEAEFVEDDGVFAEQDNWVPEPVADGESELDFNYEEDLGPQVSMPAEPIFEAAVSEFSGLTGFETMVVREDDHSNGGGVYAEPNLETVDVEYDADAFNRESEKTAAPEPLICEFCLASLSNPVIRCNDCGAILTISDLDLVFSPNTVNIEAITNKVEALVAEGCSRELSKSELVWLGFGYLNLADIDAAIAGFQEAARLDPDDVVFAAEVNALHIRHKEFKKHDPAEIEEEPAAEESKRLILVVDDSATVRKLISGKLSDAGHEVFCAADGKEALEQVIALKPDLVLLDIAMPKMDGYEVCRKIRSTPETREIPVIMISGKDGVFNEDRGRLAGSSGFITKPFGPETLMSTVASCLGTENPVVAG